MLAKIHYTIMASRIHESPDRFGFTLIELIVVISILLMISGGVIANYNNFNENQRIKQIALTLKTNLRFAQTKALSGDKPKAPFSCAELDGYTVTFSATQYSVQADCAAPDNSQGDITTVNLPTGITLSTVPATPVLEFYVRHGTNIAADITVTISGLKNYSISVSPNGTLSDLGLSD